MISNGVPPLSPSVDLSFSGLLVDSDDSALVVEAAVRTDSGMVVTDVAVVVADPSGVTNVEEIPTDLSGKAGLEIAVGAGVLVSELCVNLS